MRNKINNIIIESISVKEEISNNSLLLSNIEKAINLITKAFKQGNKVLFCGNGGSAADAQHLAAEFSGRFYKNRTALPADALHCNTSYITAVANDYGYELIYSRLIEGFGKPGDVLVAISTSGNSLNIINALKASQKLKMQTISFTGFGGGEMKKFSDILIEIPSKNTPRIQEAHILIGHIICQIVEENLF